MKNLKASALAVLVVLGIFGLVIAMNFSKIVCIVSAVAFCAYLFWVIRDYIIEYEIDGK